MSPYTTKPQMSVPIRAPRWVSSRRLLEEKLQNLHKCTNLNHVKQLHAQIIKKDLHNDLYIAPKLVSSLSLCRQMELAIKVFNYIQDPNVHLYNTLIRACVQNSMNVHAFRVFLEMQKVGVFADNFTYPFLLKACSGQNWLKVVQMIHALIEKCGFLSDIFVPNALIDSYSKCGVAGVSAAKKLFMVLGERDTVTWNSMICGLVKSGELSEARRLFDEMPERDTISWNTMLDGYTKAGEMNSAQLMRSTGIQKPSGASSIEVDNEVHEFTVYDRLHPKSEKIYEMIDTLVEDLNEASYVPKVPVDVGDGVIWDLEAWPPLLEWKKNRAKQERKRR
ncbi:hypothetical protein Patl1_21839 [Pistacia atlantica]|uniref:Uncharacterized protein n=1 Tax=Pistacia atlantica TaxID=434234 RepID=A0ACC1BIM5_9ROSI|nr:hypothetical protein Patl1_21839 [Pistacia atlantica]